MSDPTSSNILLAEPVRGADSGTWDVPMNSNTTAIDGLFGGVVVVSLSNSPLTLSAPSGTVTPSAGPTQAQNCVLRCTGALTSNVQITLPLPGYFIIENLTTGAFVLTFRAVGSGEIIGIGQGIVQHIYNDGTNVRFVNLPPVGTYMDVASSSVPSWITSCTKPPYINCDGSTFNATTYPYLNAFLGGNTLPDSRGNVRATLNQGTGRLNQVNGNVILSVGGGDTETLTQAQLPAVNLSSGFLSASTSAISYSMNYDAGSPSTPGGNAIQLTGNGTGSGPVAALTINTPSTSIGGDIPLGGSSSGHPNVQPTYVGGLTLIRAA